jgi:hypothetical protein
VHEIASWTMWATLLHKSPNKFLIRPFITKKILPCYANKLTCTTYEECCPADLLTTWHRGEPSASVQKQQHFRNLYLDIVLMLSTNPNTSPCGLLACTLHKLLTSIL